MPITRQEVEHIARLARLELSEDEIQSFQRQLSDILDYASRLGELDTRDIPPLLSEPGLSEAPSQSLSPLGTGSPLNSTERNSREEQQVGQRLPPDEPGQPLPRLQLLENAPDVRDNQFRVPPVMEDQ